MYNESYIFIKYNNKLYEFTKESKMNRKLWYLVVFSFVAVVLYYAYKKNFCSIVKIAIIQVASHPSLDAAKQGFIDVVKKGLGKDKFDFDLYNCQGSIVALENIISQVMHDKDIKLFYTIGSLPTQSVYRVESERPILFAAVSDPYVLGIHQGKSNISGISDMTPPGLPLAMIDIIVPNKKKIGLLYSYASLNKNEIMQVKKNLQSGGKEVVEIVIQNEFEIVSVLEQYLDKVDVLLSLCDNVVASSMRFIVRIANEYNVPIITTFLAALNDGVLAATGVNYNDNGRKIGEIALSILQGEKHPYHYMIQMNDNNKIYLSKEGAMRFGITLEQFENNESVILV